MQDIEIAAARIGDGFDDLSGDQQDEVLRGVESDNPEFFDLLVRHTYNGYYSNPKVVELVWTPGRPSRAETRWREATSVRSEGRKRTGWSLSPAIQSPSHAATASKGAT